MCSCSFTTLPHWMELTQHRNLFFWIKSSPLAPSWYKKAPHSIVLVSILQKDNLQERIHRSCQVTLQVPPIPEPMYHHAGTTRTMHKVAWSHFRHAVYTRIHVYASGHEKVSSGNLRSGTLANKTPAHWPRPTENWWSDPQSELLDWRNPETGPKLSADRQSTVFFKSTNPLDLLPKSTIRELFKAKSADPRTYSPPSFTDLNLFKYAFSAI